MTRAALLTSIAHTIRDFREGEIPPPTPAHVEHWINQFPVTQQERLLHEIDFTLKRTYFSKEEILKFLNAILRSKKIAGEDPAKFWRKAHFLDIQLRGGSQHEMLGLIDECMQNSFGFSLADCGADGGAYIYLDDIIFSGGHVCKDLEKWITEEAPQNFELHIIVIGFHLLGEWELKKKMAELASTTNKTIDWHGWRAASIENRKAYKARSEVLWPTETLPANELLNSYIAQQRYPMEYRPTGGTFVPEVFSSEEGRQLLEREMILSGLTIRSHYANPTPSMRPLGFHRYGFGFGSMFATFRNCPNNCPLALWWGLDEWYPLIPRKTN